MKDFSLEIITPDGLMFSGSVQSIVARTTVGDVCIMASHADYIANIDMGTVKIKDNSGERYASCIGGFLNVSSGNARIIATTFEFAEDIDKIRAEKAKERAEEVLRNSEDEHQLKIAQLKLKRALNRLSVSKKV